MRERMRRRVQLLAVYRAALFALLAYAWLRLAGGVAGPAWRASHAPELQRAAARRFRSAMLALGGLFVKLGQLLSTMTFALPEAFRGELAGLQDRAPADPYSIVRATIESDLGDPIEHLFEHFEPSPIASASLAQVHRARLADGREVAVKVQHPGIAQTAELDLRALRRLVRIGAWITGIRGLIGVHEELAEMIAGELDFRREADWITAFRARYAGAEEPVLPELVPERSGRRVLSMRFVEGIGLADRAALDAAGLDREDLARRLVAIYADMLFHGGLLHADPHPGNVLVTPDGRLALIDFGAVVRLTPGWRQSLARAVLALAARDTDGAERALVAMGFGSPTDGAESRRVRRQLIAVLSDKVFDAMSIEALSLGSLRIDVETKLSLLDELEASGVGQRSLFAALAIPPDWIRVNRSLILLLGVCAELAPELSPADLLGSQLTRLLLRGDRDWSVLARSMVSAALRLPLDLYRVLQALRSGGLDLHAADAERLLRLQHAQGQQLYFGLVGAVALLLATLRPDALWGTAGPIGLGLALTCGGISLRWMRRAGRLSRPSGPH